MKKFLSGYNLAILTIYLVIMPLIIFFHPYPLNYHLSINYQVIFLIFCFPFVYYIFNLSFNWRKFGKVNLTIQERTLTILYAFAFAIPEEILFRGIIQNFLQSIILNSIMALIASAIVFGVVHLPNGSKGLKIKEWNWSFALFAFYGGLLFGSIYMLTGSLLIPTLLHASVLIFIKLWARRNNTV